MVYCNDQNGTNLKSAIVANVQLAKTHHATFQRNGYPWRSLLRCKQTTNFKIICTILVLLGEARNLTIQGPFSTGHPEKSILHWDHEASRMLSTLPWIPLWMRCCPNVVVTLWRCWFYRCVPGTVEHFSYWRAISPFIKIVSRRWKTDVRKH